MEKKLAAPIPIIYMTEKSLQQYERSKKMDFDEMIFQALERNPQRLINLLMNSGFKVVAMKTDLTTKEMCEQANINYQSWLQSEVRNDPRIVAMRDTTSGRNHQYKATEVDKIKEIWRECKSKWR